MTAPPVSVPLAIWIICSTAIQPFSGSKLAWAVTVVLLVFATLAHRQFLHTMRLSIPLVTYLAWLALSVFWSVLPGVTAVEVVLQVLLVGAGLLMAVGRDPAQLLRLFADTAAGFVLVNIAVGLVAPSIGRSSEGPYTNVISGLFADKNLFAFFTVLALGAAMCVLLDAWRTRAVSLLDVARPAVAVVGVLLSDSATGLSLSVATILLVVLLGFLGRTRRAVVVPVAGVLLALTSLAWVAYAQWSTVLELIGRGATLTGRTRIWYAVIRAIEQRPWQGYGWKALWVDGDPTTIRIWADNYGVPFYHAHDGYLDMTAQLGIVGLVLTLLFLGTILVRGWRNTVRRGTGAEMWPVLLVAVMALYNTTEVMGFTTVAWVFLVALSSALPARSKELECTSPMPGASPSASTR